jgi:hypothetical protein
LSIAELSQAADSVGLALFYRVGKGEKAMPDKFRSPPPISVDPGYVHGDKIIEPKQRLDLFCCQLKWYDISTRAKPVPETIHLKARAFLEERAGEGGLDQLSDRGFAILHRCGEHFYFLIVCSWQGNNEIWEAVFAMDLNDRDFRDWPRPGPHVPTFCVWEMGAVTHESQAWMRFLRSKRDEQAVQTWLSDQYRGPI